MASSQTGLSSEEVTPNPLLTPEVRRAVQALCESIPIRTGFDEQGVGLFGPAAPSHALGVVHPMPILGSFVETTTTKGVAYFLGAEMWRNPTVSAARVTAFVRALVDSIEAWRLPSDPPINLPLPGGPDGLLVEAESKTDDDLRLDLLLAWLDADGVRRVLVIEAKHDREDHRLPLKKYRQFATKRFGVEPVCAFVARKDLEVPNGDPGHHWYASGWFDLLRRFERHLAAIGDPAVWETDAFRFYRRQLWAAHAGASI